jgi:hypothetical protein
MQGSAEEPGGDEILGPGMPGWEKATWLLVVVYIIIVLVVFWYLGWKELGFPL